MQLWTVKALNDPDDCFCAEKGSGKREIFLTVLCFSTYHLWAAQWILKSRRDSLFPENNEVHIGDFSSFSEPRILDQYSYSMRYFEARGFLLIIFWLWLLLCHIMLWAYRHHKYHDNDSRIDNDDWLRAEHFYWFLSYIQVVLSFISGTMLLLITIYWIESQRMFEALCSFRSTKFWKLQAETLEAAYYRWYAHIECHIKTFLRHRCPWYHIDLPFPSHLNTFCEKKYDMATSIQASPHNLSMVWLGCNSADLLTPDCMMWPLIGN